MSSSLSVLSSRRSIGEEDNENPPLTGMQLGFQQFEERIIDATTQLHHVPSIIDSVGCDITLEDIQLAKQEMINQKINLQMDVNESQKLTAPWNGDIPDMILTSWVTPMNHFCLTGNLLIVRVLFLIGADCTKFRTLGTFRYRFPMLSAAERGHVDICQWLFKYGGDAKYQINTETSWKVTPLLKSYEEWHYGRDQEGKTCRWLLQNGGGQHLSSAAMCRFIEITGKKEMKSNLLVLWMREHMQLHDTFLLLLCGVTTRIATSSSEASGDTRKVQHERALQILDGHPGIMELIGDYVGFLREKEFRMVKEFNELVIEHTTEESSSDDDNGDNEEEE